ncbi:MAG: hypothetical protein NXI18_21710 [Alphaproteobacteria bacterium]|nr:hypothetical protein [Alphaproteobacteria bacterium]
MHAAFGGEPRLPLAAIEALDSGRPDCARCILEFDVDQELRDAENFRNEHDSGEWRDYVDREIANAEAYRSTNPWDLESCFEACENARRITSP